MLDAGCSLLAAHCSIGLTMLQSNLNNLVSGKIRTHGRILASLPNHIRLVGLLPVHGQAVLVAEDCHGLERQLVCGTEDTDGDLASVGDEQLLHLHDGAVGTQALVHRVGVRVLAIWVRRAEFAAHLFHC